MGVIHIKIIATSTTKSDHDWITGKLNEAKAEVNSIIKTVIEEVPDEAVVAEFDIEKPQEG